LRNRGSPVQIDCSSLPNVQVSLPEQEARRLDGQHQLMDESLRRLAALAEAAAAA